MPGLPVASTPVGISASRGAAILGLSEFQSPLEVWQLLCEERTPGFNAVRGYTLPEHKDSAPLRWGKAFEPAVIALAEEALESRIDSREAAFYLDFKGLEHDNPAAGPITCHIDGWYRSPDLGEATPLHEGKTTSLFPFREKWGPEGTDKIPVSYAVQTQHQLACTGAELDIVSVLVFPETPDKFEELGWQVVKNGLDEWCVSRDSIACRPCYDWADVFRDIGNFHQYPVPANRDAQRGLLDAYRHFWDHNILTGIEPEPRTYDDVKRLFPEPKKTIVCPPLIAGWFAEMKAIGEEIGEGGSMSKRKKRLAQITLDWARKQDGTLDDESRTATIFRDEAGKKLGQFAKQKNGVLVFRAS
jgi:hypothetical protein